MFRPITYLQPKSKVEQQLFDPKQSSNKTTSLQFSTGDKKRMIKRREIVKSMKFLRKMGEKIREEQNKIAAELIKQDKKIKRQSKKQKLKKAQTIEAYMTQQSFHRNIAKAALEKRPSYILPIKNGRLHILSPLNPDTSSSFISPSLASPLGGGRTSNNYDSPEVWKYRDDSFYQYQECSPAEGNETSCENESIHPRK